MSEYWVSQAKKYCEFCKCWIADNKPSRDFHEKGKKHQENVKKKIDEVRKKSIKDAQKEKEMSDSIREMNENAMRAFKKDLMRDPSLRAQYGVKVKSKEPEPEEPVYGPAPKPETSDGTEDSTNTAKEGTSQEDEEEDEDEEPAEEEEEEVGTWEMAVSEQGYPYYWNNVTSEVTWVAPLAYLKQQGIPPEDYHKYTTVEEKDEQKKKKKSAPKERKQSPPKSPSQDNEGPAPKKVKVEEKEVKIAPKKAKVEEKEVKIATPETSTENLLPASIPLPEDIPLPPGPETKKKPELEEEEKKSDSDSDEEKEVVERQHEHKRPVSHAFYGGWEQVQPEAQPDEIDLQLPQVEKAEQTVIIPANEPKIKFRKKTVSSLGSGPVFFKKPKKKMTAAQFLKKREDS